MPDSCAGVMRFMLSHWGPRLYTVLLAGCLALRFHLGWSWLDVLIIAGLISLRGILEWVLHAYFWHARRLPLLGRVVNPLTVLHARHHKNPVDTEALLFSGPSVLVVFVLMMLSLTLALPSFSLALTVSIASLAILMIHEFYHVVAHSDIEPRSVLLRPAVLCHRAHHYIDASVCMGVSSILGDKLFGTYRQHES
jgi:MFS family permease